MERPLTFPRSHRLVSPALYQRVYDAKVRASTGPLTTYSLPNDLGHGRFGMSVSRKVGKAVSRNRIRRLLREGFRRIQHDFPRGYDLVVVVRPHKPLPLEEYRRLLLAALVRLHGLWEKAGLVQRRDAEVAEKPDPDVHS